MGSRCAQVLVGWVREHLKQRDLYRDETISQSVVARPDLLIRSFPKENDPPAVPIRGFPVPGTVFNLDAANPAFRLLLSSRVFKQMTNARQMEQFGT